MGRAQGRKNCNLDCYPVRGRQDKRLMGGSPPAHERDTPAVSLPQLTLSVRLCDYADCRKPHHKVCKGVACCSKDCQVCVASHPACALSRALAQETGKHDQVTRTP